MQCNYGVGSSWPSEKFVFTIFDRIRSVLYDYYTHTHTHTHLFVIIHVGEGSHYILCMYFSVFCILSWKRLETHSCAWATFDIVLYKSISTECVTKWVYHTLESNGGVKGLRGGGGAISPHLGEAFLKVLLVQMNQQNVILHRQNM